MLASKDEFIEVCRLISELDFLVGQKYNSVNMHGQRFGKLTVMCISNNSIAAKKDHYVWKKRQWLWLCDCGNTGFSTRENLIQGKVLSCGCSRYSTMCLLGERFGGLFVKADAGFKDYKYRRRKLWECVCDCGKLCLYTTEVLRKGEATSCGCRANMKEKLDEFWRTRRIHSSREAGIKAWKRNNPIKVAQIFKNWQAKARRDLRDSYVARLIQKSTGLHVKDIPRPLLEAVREHRRVQRLLKGDRA